jgi:hypothetical protein
MADLLPAFFVSLCVFQVDVAVDGQDAEEFFEPVLLLSG